MKSELADIVRSFATSHFSVSAEEAAIIERAATAIESGEPKAALTILRAGAADAQGPAQAFAYAETAMQTGHAAMAVPLMRQWTQRQSDRADIWFAYGSVMNAVNDSDEAAMAFETALRLAPGNPDIQAALGRTLYAMGRPSEALPLLEDVIQAQPDDAYSLLTLSYVKASLGARREAIDLAERILAERPFNSNAFFQLAEISPDQAQVYASAAEDLIENEKAIPEDRATAAFAIGRLLERQGEKKKAFEKFRRANTIRREALRQAGGLIDARHWRDSSDQLRRDFPIDRVKACAAHGSKSEEPVFIVGMPRTGSTLTEQVLSGHKDISSLGEVYALARTDHLLQKASAQSGQNHLMCLEDSATVQRLSAHYLNAIKGGRDDALRRTDKMLLNYKRVALIAILFPRARVIHCTRDPRDVGLSIFKHRFNVNMTYSHDLPSIANRILECDSVMAYGRELLGAQLLTVRYEDMVDNLESESRRIVEHLGLPWDEACLDFDRSKRSVVTLSQSQVRQPIYMSSAGAWRDWERELQPLIEILTDNGAL